MFVRSCFKYRRRYHTALARWQGVCLSESPSKRSIVQLLLGADRQRTWRAATASKSSFPPFFLGMSTEINRQKLSARSSPQAIYTHELNFHRTDTWIIMVPPGLDCFRSEHVPATGDTRVRVRETNLISSRDFHHVQCYLPRAN